jgi:type VI secretion system protein
MKTGLFDGLCGSPDDDLLSAHSTENEARYVSVLRNLTFLLNARRGAVAHLPDYGLPDLGSLYRGMPDSIEELRQTVQETIEKYEPRLRRVRVKVLPSESSHMRLTLMLTAELDGERVRFTTMFSSAAPVSVGEYVRDD